MSLGERIREQRIQAGLSQEQLAEKLNVSRQAITKQETDKGIPDVANLIAISDEFGLSLDELIKGDVAVKKKKGKGKLVEANRELVKLGRLQPLSKAGSAAINIQPGADFFGQIV